MASKPCPVPPRRSRQRLLQAGRMDAGREGCLFLLRPPGPFSWLHSLLFGALDLCRGHRRSPAVPGKQGENRVSEVAEARLQEPRAVSFLDMIYF